MASLQEAPAGDALSPDALASRAAAQRERGNALFKRGHFVEATAAYSEAILLAEQGEDAAAALRDASPAARAAAAGAPARQRVASLCNRASCALRLSRPAAALDDTWAAMVACCAPGAPAWERKLRRETGWREWTRSAYFKAVLRRAQATEAAGVPLAAQADLIWGASADTTRDADAADAGVLSELKRHEAALRALPDAPCPRGGAAPDSADDCIAEVVCPPPLRVARGAPAPRPRRGGAAAAVCGTLYLFGGEAFGEVEMQWAHSSDFDEFMEHRFDGLLQDAWRLRLGGPSAAR
jgi:hypothetical protein